jgi:pre-mRNA-splicing factor ATP-dependent RNA helicase DHX38/PRP16
MNTQDPTSDMAVIARKGSDLVKQVREKKDQNKSRQRFWDLAGRACWLRMLVDCSMTL